MYLKAGVLLEHCTVYMIEMSCMLSVTASWTNGSGCNGKIEKMAVGEKEDGSNGKEEKIIDVKGGHVLDLACLNTSMWS